MTEPKSNTTPTLTGIATDQSSSTVIPAHISEPNAMHTSIKHNSLFGVSLIGRSPAKHHAVNDIENISNANRSMANINSGGMRSAACMRYIGRGMLIWIERRI